MNWIDVEEKLPKDNQIVIGWILGRNCPSFFIFYIKSNGTFLWQELINFNTENTWSCPYIVSHWMPFDFPPQNINSKMKRLNEKYERAPQYYEEYFNRHKCEICGSQEGKKQWVCHNIQCNTCWEKRYNKID